MKEKLENITWAAAGFTTTRLALFDKQSTY